MTTFSQFEAADYLDNDEVMAEYITAALANPNPDVLLTALNDVARARGMTQVAATANLGRESLYKTLAPGAKPRFETVVKVLHGLGVQLVAAPLVR